MSGGHHSRPFSPYRHAPTTEDLLHAAVRGRSLAIPEEDEHEQEQERSIARSKTHSQALSQISKTPSQPPPSQLMSPGRGKGKAPSVVSSRHSNANRDRDMGGDATPRARSPAAALALHNLNNANARDHSLDMDQEEAKIVADALAGRTPRTSYYGSASLEDGAANHYHDVELCILLQQESDPGVHEFVKKALRKAVRQRVKKLGMKYDNEVSFIIIIITFQVLTFFFVWLVNQAVQKVVS
jgi:hypothetical protein